MKSPLSITYGKIFYNKQVGETKIYFEKKKEKSTREQPASHLLIYISILYIKYYFKILYKNNVKFLLKILDLNIYLAHLEVKFLYFSGVYTRIGKSIFKSQ